MPIYLTPLDAHLSYSIRCPPILYRDVCVHIGMCVCSAQGCVCSYRGPVVFITKGNSTRSMCVHIEKRSTLPRKKLKYRRNPLGRKNKEVLHNNNNNTCCFINDVSSVIRTVTMMIAPSQYTIVHTYTWHQVQWLDTQHISTYDNSNIT